MNITLKHIIESAHSEVVVAPIDAEEVLTSLEWDSRLVGSGSLFAAIIGEKQNGNDFIIEALEAGARAVIASQDPSPQVRAFARNKGAALLLAHDKDVLGALQALARSWRETLKATIIGVTGSSGKTTTKDLIAEVLSRSFDTHATAGNRNSELGLSETIVNATVDTEVIVCEMGMQARGEIAALCTVAQPHIAVVTNVGVAHCELLGSRENIARAKAELLESLPDKEGLAVLPGDDSYAAELQRFGRLKERKVSIITYGLGEQNDIRATSISYDDRGRPSFKVWTPDGLSYPVRLSLQGEHNVLNALAAVAVGLRVGVPVDSILEALAVVEPAALRQEMVTTTRGDLILNDTYNANPDSMRAALSLLKRLSTQGKRVAVLGDMYELGPEEESYHRQIGAYAFVNGVDELITVGSLGAEIAQGALAVGMPPTRVHSCADVPEALAVLEDHFARSPQLVILAKASRGMQLERIVEGLLDKAVESARDASGWAYMKGTL